MARMDEKRHIPLWRYLLAGFILCLPACWALYASGVFGWTHIFVWIVPLCVYGPLAAVYLLTPPRI